MNISLTPDDIMAAATVGGIVIAPVLGYIRFVHGQQAAMWRGIDKMKEAQASFVNRDDQEKHLKDIKGDFEKYRLEIKSDLQALETRIVKEIDKLAKGNR